MAFSKCNRCYMMTHDACRVCHVGSCCWRNNKCRCVMCGFCKKVHEPREICEGCDNCMKKCKCPSIPNYDARLLSTLNTSCYETCRVCKGEDVECKNCKNDRRIPTFVVNELRRALGVEVELAEWGSLAIQNGSIQDQQGQQLLRYHAVHDGSVRPSGHEMVISPLAGDRFVLGMIGLGGLIDLNKCSVNNTCGLHVHVDGSDFSPFDIRRLLYALDRIEPEIYSLCSAARKASAYCFPLMDLVRKLDPSFMMNLSRMRDGGDIKAAIYKTFYMLEDRVDPALAEKALRNPTRTKKIFGTRRQIDTVNEMIRAKYGPTHRLRHLNMHDHLDNLRYAGVNLQSWLYRGSIEFRMKEGTTNVQTLLMWPLLCGWVVEAISRLTDNQVLKSLSLMDILLSAKAPQGVIEYLENLKAKKQQ